MTSSFYKKLVAAASAALVFASATPVLAAAHTEGTNVSKPDGSVCMVRTGQLQCYTSAGAFLSYGFNSWSQVVAANSDDLALPMGSFIAPQDGSVIFSDRGADKGTGYILSGGMKYGFPTEAIFKAQGYSYATAMWADISWVSMGGTINAGDAAHLPGTLVNNGGTVQLIGNSGLMGIPDLATFNSWGYSFAKVVPANANDKAKAQTGVMPMRMAGQLSPTGITTTNPNPTGSVSATISSTNPAAMTLVAGQSRADLAHITFTGTGTVTNLKLKRIGVSSDSTLGSLFLYDGATRITDSATVSSSVITFNDPTGLFTVSGSKTISVQANIATGTSGQTVGVMVDSFMTGSTAGSGTPSGNIHTIASVSDFASADFNATTTPATATISAQADYVMWQNTVNVGTRKVWLKSIALRQIGSVLSSDLGNFRFYVDGVQKGTAVASIASNGYVTFDFMSAPVELSTGSRQLKLVGDVIGGSNRNFSFSLQQASDALLVDSQYNAAVTPTAASATFSARTTGTESIDTGSLTFTKRVDSASGNIVIEGSNVSYGKFDVKAYGEAMKVESLKISVVESDADTALTLRNGALYLDGVQVGSTTAIASVDDATLGYTTFNFGSSFIVNPGTPRVLEIRADVYDNDGTNEVVDADTLKIRVESGSSNVQRMTSLGYGSYPAADVDGNTLTVSTGSLTVAKNTSYANHTVVVPKTAYKIGSYTIQASSTEGATITSMVFDFDEDANAFLASADLTSLYAVVGSTTLPTKSSVTATGNTFSTNIAIAAGQSVAVDVYADIAVGATDGGTDDTSESSLTVSYTTAQSGTSTSASEVDGQTITAAQSGTFSTAVAGTSPLARIVAANQTVTGADFEFTAVNETFSIKEVTVKVASATVASAINAVQLYDGATPVGAPTALSQQTNTAALITGLSIPVTAGSPKTLTAKLILNTVGAGAGTSGVNAALTLDSVKYADSNGVEATSGTDRAANTMYVFRAIPTVTKGTVTKSDIVNGTQYDLYNVAISASAQGPVYLKQLSFTTTWNDNATTADTLEVEQLKLFENGVDITDRVVIQDEDGNSVEAGSGMVEADGTLTISWATGNQGTVAAGSSNTYVVKGVITGFTDTADSVTFQMIGDAAVPTASHTYLNGTVATIWGLHDSAAATSAGELHNFIWSDGSANPHANAENASSSADWFNGYKVLNFDLTTETWQKDI